MKRSISYYGRSDMGRVRTNNEDAFVAQNLWDDQTVLAVVIDGVGGYDGGEVAADIARTSIPEYLQVSPNGERVELLKQAVTAANNAICEAKETDGQYPKMSCVLTAAIVDMAQRQVSMAHVGDTRLYMFHNGELKKLSHDHSLVGYREEIGDLTEEQAMHHPQRNVINRDVGSERHKADDEEFIEAEVFPLIPNTVFLLCSDGLTDLVTSAEICTVLGQKGSLQHKTRQLIDLANEKGGKDNVTVVLVEYLSDEPMPAAQPMAATTEAVPQDVIVGMPVKKKRKWGILLASLALAILLAALGLYFGFCRDKSSDSGKPTKPTVEAIPIVNEEQPQPKHCGCPYCPYSCNCQ